MARLWRECGENNGAIMAKKYIHELHDWPYHDGSIYLVAPASRRWVRAA
jgi:hypothetical protein